MLRTCVRIMNLKSLNFNITKQVSSTQRQQIHSTKVLNLKTNSILLQNDSLDDPKSWFEDDNDSEGDDTTSNSEYTRPKVKFHLLDDKSKREFIEHCYKVTKISGRPVPSQLTEERILSIIRMRSYTAVKESIK
jgi:hypothetical protein